MHDDDGCRAPEGALRQLLDDVTDGVVVVRDHRRRRGVAEVRAQRVVHGERHVDEVGHHVGALWDVRDEAVVGVVPVPEHVLLVEPAGFAVPGVVGVRGHAARSRTGDELAGPAGVEVLDVAGLPVHGGAVLLGPFRLVRRHVDAVVRRRQRVLAVDRHAQLPRARLLRRDGAGPDERLEEVAALGVVEHALRLLDRRSGLRGRRPERVAVAMGTAHPVVVVGRPGLLVVVGRDGTGGVGVAGHRHLCVAEEVVTQAGHAVREHLVLVGGDGLAVQQVGGIRVVAGVRHRGTEVAEVLVEGLVLGDDVHDVPDR